MKTRLFTTAVLLALSLSGAAQNKASLEKSTKNMIELKDHENYTDLAGTVYSKVSEVINLEEYFALEHKKLNGSDYKSHTDGTEPVINYGEIKKTDPGITYSIITYDAIMVIELDKKIEPNNIPNEEAYFNKLFGARDATYVQDKNTVNLTKRSRIVAIADETSGYQWTFADPSIPEVYDVLPEAVKKELDKQKAPEGPTKKETIQKTDSKEYRDEKAREAKIKSAEKS